MTWLAESATGLLKFGAWPNPTTMINADNLASTPAPRQAGSSVTHQRSSARWTAPLKTSRYLSQNYTHWRSELETSVAMLEPANHIIKPAMSTAFSSWWIALGTSTVVTGGMNHTAKNFGQT
jgi:hypothetical protein